MPAKKKETERWREARALIAAQGNRRIQDTKDKSHRNANVYEGIATAVKKQGGFPERD